jgi:hypothetical protein
MCLLDAGSLVVAVMHANVPHAHFDAPASIPFLISQGTYYRFKYPHPMPLRL